MQVRSRAMQESPQALPLRQVLQQATAGVVAYDARAGFGGGSMHRRGRGALFGSFAPDAPDVSTASTVSTAPTAPTAEGDRNDRQRASASASWGMAPIVAACAAGTGSAGSGVEGVQRARVHSAGAEEGRRSRWRRGLRRRM